MNRYLRIREYARRILILGIKIEIWILILGKKDKWEGQHHIKSSNIYRLSYSTSLPSGTSVS